MANEVAKAVSIFYLVAVTLLFGTNGLVQPLKFYQDGVGREQLDSTPPNSIAVMEHMSFVNAFHHMLTASVVICLVFTHEAPRLGMSIIATFWIIDIIPHLLYPWPKGTEDTVLDVLGMKLHAVWIVVFTFIALGLVGFFTSTHDLENSKKKKKKN